MSTSERAALWCAEGNSVIKLAYFSYISLPWQHVAGTTMKMRTLLLLKCESPSLVCACGCVCISSQRSVFMLCLPKLYVICIFVCSHLFDLILPFIPHFIFRFPLEVKMFFLFFWFFFYYFLALVVPCSQWTDIVCFAFLVIKGFYHSQWAWNLSTCIRQEVAWAENQITL